MHPYQPSQFRYNIGEKCRLTKKGKRLKQEVHLKGNRWQSSHKTEVSQLCESSNFEFDVAVETKGPFTISFANDKAEQEEHYHKYHAEIYFSEHKISGYYRGLYEDNDIPVELGNGGLVLFQPNIIHFMELSGLTLILETPALEKDRFVKLTRDITNR